ncbi:MAG TPA: hypothetical protein VMV46_11300 [Thermoanaerobaculia bacterium]|nr:hypothetical protein [Thermoanaerobaculia bacterium]
MSAKTIIVLLSLLTAQTVPATAQRRDSGERLKSEIRFSGLLHDNFFEAPEDGVEEEVTAGRVEGRIALALSEDGPWEVYGRGSFTAYEGGLEDSSALRAGMRYDRLPRALDLHLQYQQDRPTLDVGDEFDRADVLRLAGEYSHRLSRDWQITGLIEAERQEFDTGRGKDNDLYSGGGSLRYRGWGYRISPEVGIELGERDAVSPNQDHDQRDLWIQLRSIPVPAVYLSLRYRLRWRDYSIDDRAASNFGREDDRSDWTLGFDVRTGELVTWNLYYSYQDAESTKPSRTFTNQFLSLGITLAF